MKEKQRLDYLDVMKAIGILAVVVLHALENAPATRLTTHPLVIWFIHPLTIELFFFVNGYLYKNKNIDHPIMEILRKVKVYYLPFLGYNLFYLALHNVFAKLHMVDENFGNGAYSAKEYVKHFFLALTGHREYFTGAMWFLGSLLIVSSIVICVEFFCHKFLKDQHLWKILTVVVVICAIAGCSGYLPETFKFATSLAKLPLFYMGILFRRFDFGNKLKSDEFSLKKLVFLFFVVAIDVFVSYNKQYNPFGMQGAFAFYSLGYINATVCIVGIYFISHSKWLMKSKVLKVIGQSTLDIMAFHFCCFKIVSLVIIYVYDLPITRLAEYPVLRDISGLWPLAYVMVGVPVSILLGKIRISLKNLLIQKLPKRQKKVEH